MKRSLVSIFLFAVSFKGAFCQSKNIVFDTVSTKPTPSNHYYYRATDFNFIDSVSYWAYDFSPIDSYLKDSLSFGSLIFFRSIPIDDKIIKEVYGRKWVPHMKFSIFSLKDSLHCYSISNNTRKSSSCIPPDVGGDIIKIGQFILVSRGVCIWCGKPENQIDYCRPVINQILSRIDRNIIVSLNSLINMIPIPSKYFEL